MEAKGTCLCKQENAYRGLFQNHRQDAIRQETDYLSELRRDFLASIGITYAVFQIAKSRLSYLSKLRP